MTMRRFEVECVAPRLGRLKHVVRASDDEEAKKKVRKAHPNCDVVSCSELRGRR
jgi:hypothetical protein